MGAAGLESGAEGATRACPRAAAALMKPETDVRKGASRWQRGSKGGAAGKGGRVGITPMSFSICVLQLIVNRRQEFTIQGNATGQRPLAGSRWSLSQRP